MNLKEDYLKKQSESGLKIGDRVKITRKAESHEQGWNNGWEPKYMDDSVGKIVTIKEITNVGIGFVGLLCNYPYFILEKVPTQDEYVNRILGVKKEDIITDLVTNDGLPSTYRKVTRRMKILSEWNGGRLILVDMSDDVELRRQNKHEFHNKEWVWETNLTLSLTNEEVNKIKETIDGWI